MGDLLPDDVMQEAAARAMHDPETCSRCQSLSALVRAGDVSCHGNGGVDGKPCDLCLGWHGETP